MHLTYQKQKMLIVEKQWPLIGMVLYIKIIDF